MQNVSVRFSAAVAIVGTAALLAVIPAGPAAQGAVPGCPYATGTYYEWTGNGPTDRWGDPGNWNAPDGDPATTAPNDNPNGNGTVHTTNTRVCIGTGETVRVTPDGGLYVNHYLVQAFFLGAGAVVEILPGASLTAEGSEESLVSPGARVDVFSGTFGGPSQVRIEGLLTVSAHPDVGGATLTSRPPFFASPDTPGTLLVAANGQLRFPSYGVNITDRYRAQVFGAASVEGTGSIAANYGTRFEVAAGGQLALAGRGGYYQGATEGFTELSDLVNAGRIVKTGSGTSVIDARYSQLGVGTVVVESGAVAFPDGTVYPADVRPGQTLTSEECAPRPELEVCPVQTDPNADPQTIGLRMPAQGDPDGAEVTVLERQLSTPCAATTPATGTIVFDGDAHAEGLTADPANPALVQIRIDARCGSSPEFFTVLRDEQPLPSCLGSGSPPAGQDACLDRRGLAGSSRTEGANVYVVARTTLTSRWRVRKEARDLYAPTVLARGAASGKLKRGKISVTLDQMFAERCTVHTRGTLRITNPKLDKKLGIRDAAHSAAPGAPVTFAIKPKRNHQKFLTKAAKSGKAKLSYHCDDFSGNATPTRTITIRLK